MALSPRAGGAGPNTPEAEAFLAPKNHFQLGFHKISALTRMENTFSTDLQNWVAQGGLRRYGTKTSSCHLIYLTEIMGLNSANELEPRTELINLFPVSGDITFWNIQSCGNVLETSSLISSTLASRLCSHSETFKSHFCYTYKSNGLKGIKQWINNVFSTDKGIEFQYNIHFITETVGEIAQVTNFSIVFFKY